MPYFSVNRDGTELKLCFNCLRKESRKEKRSKDSIIASMLLSTEIDNIIHSDSLEQSQDTSAHSSPLSMKACSLSIPDYFCCSNEIKEETSEGTSVSSAPLRLETRSMINSDNERKEETSEDTSTVSVLISA